MDETLVQVLKAYGLSEKEAQVYLVALQIGKSPASSLARKAGFNRWTTYTLLQQLKEKQVVQSIEYKGVTHFYAVQPEALFKKLEEKYETFKAQLPTFAALAEQYDNRPRIQYFEGLAWLKLLYEDLLTSQSTIYAFLGTQKLSQAMETYLYEEFLPRRVATKISAKVLLWPDPANKKYVGNDKKTLKQCKIVKDVAFDLHVEINLYGPNKVSIALFSDDEMSGFIVHSPRLYTSLLSIFTVLWKAA
jgi:sugar-specific transcriptional regulator TrmB